VCTERCHIILYADVMSSVKVALVAALAAVCLAACGSSAKPEAGTPGAVAKSRKNVDDPRKKHLTCLHKEHIQVRRVTIGGLPGMQIGVRPTGPTVQFQPTPGDAQGVQIAGRSQGAEVIGSALLYPNQASDKLLSKVETCVAQGVQG
jgi:hypothetical protein